MHAGMSWASGFRAPSPSLPALMAVKVAPTRPMCTTMSMPWEQSISQVGVGLRVCQLCCMPAALLSVMLQDVVCLDSGMHGAPQSSRC